VEVVEECCPPNFNLPLTEPNDPILFQVREIFSEPFSLFSDPPTMLGPNVSSSIAEHMSPSSSGIGGNSPGGILTMSTLPPLRSIRPTLSISFYVGPLIWGTLVVSSFPSFSIPSVPTPITSTSLHTSRLFSSGGRALVMTWEVELLPPLPIL
jgi:hypothetical protein